MKVKEVVALAAQTLGRDDLAEALDTLGGDPPEGEVKSLLRCYNLIENEVALDFFPLRSAERFLPVKGKIEYARFAYAPVNILKVTNVFGAPVDFALTPTYLSVPETEGEVEVAYAYSPPVKDLGDETAFSEHISARLLAFGVASEFCITNRRFSEGAMWGKKYRDALRAAGIYRRTLSVRARRWV